MNQKAQGPLEYMLLMGGAVLIAGISPLTVFVDGEYAAGASGNIVSSLGKTYVGAQYDFANNTTTAYADATIDKFKLYSYERTQDLYTADYKNT